MTTKKTATRSDLIPNHPRGYHFKWAGIDVTPQMVRDAIEAMRAIAHEDPEVAHSMQDELWSEVLDAVATGRASNPAVLCATALMTHEVDFQRWYA